MNLSQLVVSVITAILLILTTEWIRTMPMPHNHFEETVHRNVNLQTTITLCTHNRDTMQVMNPNSKYEKHINYE